MEPGDELSYAAGVSALLTELKLEDDIRDERGARRLAARAARPVSRRHLRRAGVDPALAELVRSRLDELYALEAGHKSGELVFGELLGDVFAYGLGGSAARIASEIGRGVGRYIYIVDAVDDIADDAKKNRWNPISSLWEGLPLDTAKSATEDAIRLGLGAAGAATELIGDVGGYPEALAVVQNVLFSGMPKEARRVITKWTAGSH